MDISEVVSVIGKDVGLLHRQALQNPGASGLGETAKIRTVTFALGETTMSEEVRRVGEELSVIFPEVVARHLAIVASALEEVVEVVVRVATVACKMGVALAHIILELVESGSWIRTCDHARDILPSVALDTCIASSPLDSILRGERSASRELRDVFKETIESRGIGREPRGFAAVGHRHRFCSCHREGKRDW
jgi:hypothetical protein